MDLYVLKDFNNYFNRKVIRLSTLQDYLDAVEEGGYFVVENTNFNPNDGISTSHVIGSGTHPFDKDWQPDYALVIDWPDGGEPRIVSRWFVTESARTMGKQYTVALKRDSVVDKYDEVISAQTYILKAPLKDNDPLIVNNEGIQFNQIKTAEYFIKDETKIPWIVCYLNQNERPYKEINAVYSSSEIEELEDHPDIMSFLGITGVPRATLRNDIVFNDNINFKYRYGYDTFQVFWARYTINEVEINATPTSNKYGYKNLSTVEASESVLNNSLLYYSKLAALAAWGDGWAQGMKTIAQRLASAIQSNFNTFTQTYYNAANCTHHSTGYSLPNWAKKYNGQTFYSRTANRYFTFYLEIKDPSKDYISNTKQISFIEQHQGEIGNYGLNIDATRWDVTFSTKRYSYNLSDTDGASIRLNLLGTKTETGHAKAFESKIQPYDIICFPATDIDIIDEDGNTVQCLGDSGYNIARAIAAQLGTDNLYDIQIMPFCPCRELLNDDGKIDLRKCGRNQALPVFETGGIGDRTVSYCLFCSMPWAEFSTDVVYTHYYHTAPSILIKDALALTDRKLQANCDMWRLVSPNFAGAFEFNVAKCYPVDESEQSSFMTTFNIDVCFRPHNPYIHVNPNFGFLYGQDFNDARGLICSGDFGLTVLSNAWVDYQVRNKNYQNIFDRQIQNMETNRQIAREQEQWDMGWQIADLIKGQFNDAPLQGFSGFMSGGPIGGIVSSVKAGVDSLYGGAKGIGGALKNMEWSERAYKEQRSFATDMFNMNMDNIKALPNSITHTSSITNNYKFFPMLEYYTCTEQEKQALRDKIKYNGMTVGRIDRIVNYLSETDETYIQGQIIRLERVSDDAHLAQDIYNELTKGLFFVPDSMIARFRKEVK